MYTEKTNRSIARTVAGAYWGNVDHQVTLSSGAWEFSCTSHGGIVVDTNVFPEFAWCSVFVPKRKGAHVGYYSQQHFAILEEDCDAALYAFVHGCEEKQMNAAIETLRLYHPEWYQVFSDVISNEKWKPGLWQLVQKGHKTERSAAAFLTMYFLAYQGKYHLTEELKKQFKKYGFVLKESIPTLETGFQFN